MQNKAKYSQLSISIELDIKTQQQPESQEQNPSKKVKLPNSFRQLKSQAGSFANKTGVKNEIVAVLYAEEENLVTVEDDEDFELCLEKAVKSEAKSVTFLVRFAEKERQEAQDGQKQTRKPKKPSEDKADIPLKAIQNLINKELKGQIADIFTELIQEKSRSKIGQWQPQF